MTLGNSSKAVESTIDLVVDESGVVYLSPYGVSCIGVRHSLVTDNDVSYFMTVKEEVLLWYPALLTTGIVLLWIVPSPRG